MPGKPLAPPQMDPPKPTPTSNRDARGRIIKPVTGYNASKDTFTYLGAGQATAYCVRTTNKITTALSVQNSTKADSLESLQASMAAVTAKFTDPAERRGVQIQDIRGDPEKDKLEAIEAEKQKMRAQRRLENQQKREQERSSRVLGVRSGRGTGLTVGGLEDDEDGAGPRHKMSRGKPSARGSGRTRRDEYSEEEEEMYGRRGGPQDNYEKDDFVVDDEDDSAGGEGEDEDAEGEDDEDVIETRERRSSPKRSRIDEDRAPTQASPVSRTKRRRIVDSDEDE
jgi:RNA polymerase-associated protein LEO1